jgi:hypothetical protein
MYGASPGQIGIQFAIQHPFSRSSIQITSHPAFDAPAINLNYLSVSYDTDFMRT